MKTETEIHRWLRHHGGSKIGDDAAELNLAGDYVVTVDAQHAGIHFPSDLEPPVVARRLIAVNLSDLAAMGAEPRYALLCLCAPPDFAHSRFFRAVVRELSLHNMELIGGDVSRLDRLSLTMTLVGERTREGRLLRRSGARPGHRIWVGGTLGMAALGLRLVQRGARIAGRRVVLPEQVARLTSKHRLLQPARRAIRRQLEPKAQIQLGCWLACNECSAAIDISDGLGRDLARLCQASGVGARVKSSSLPLDPGARALCESLGEDPMELATSGGEDYVLLFTLPASRQPPATFRAHEIGEITNSRRVLLAHADGASSDLRSRGWDHYLSEAVSGSSATRG